LSFSKLESYDLVRVAGCNLVAEPGHPLLPQKLLSIAVPEGSRVKSVRLVSVKTEDVEGKYSIYPAQPEVPISIGKPSDWVPPDQGIYGSRNLYPAAVAETKSQGSLAGHWIANVVVNPIRYRPGDGKLTLCTRVEFELELEHSVNPLPVSVRSGASERLIGDVVRSLVVNPGAVSSRVAQGTPELGSNDVEYLIITSTALASQFQKIADWKTEKGVPAEVVTTDWVFANYSGVDNAEKMRNCIIDYYTNKGLVFVLVGGDVDVVPYRGCYGEVGSYVDNTMPCDLYFSDLDGDFNADKDGIYGEIADAVDLYPDVFVGRAPVSSAAECSIFVRKSLIYEDVQDGTPIPCDYQLKMLYLAEWLDGSTDAGLGKNMIDNQYVPPRYDPISKLYESLGNLSASISVDSMNTGYCIINHSGHCNYTVMSVGPDLLTTSHMYGLTNDTRFSVLYSIGCICAGFEYDDCIAEDFVLAPNGGGFFAGNSRYGWYSPGNPGGGTSERYDQMFFSCLFDGTNGRLGMAEAISKTYYIAWSMDYNPYRWVQFVQNVLGEPECFVWTDTPKSLSPIYASAIGHNATKFTVDVKAGGQPVPSALVCIRKTSEIYLRDYTDANGQVTFSLPAKTPGTMYITITGQNCLPHRGTTQIVLAPDRPALLAPLDGVKSGERRPTMVWSSTVGPTGSYTLEYSNHNDFSLDVVTITDLGDTSYVIPDSTALADGIYYWHAQAVNQLGFPSGYQDNPWRLTVDNAPPQFSNTYQWPDTTFQGPYFVETAISDLSGIQGAYLAYRTDADTVWKSVGMGLLAPQGIYYAYIGEQPYGVAVNYYVYAADSSNPVNSGADPSDAPASFYSFNVVEPVGVELTRREAGPSSFFLNTSPNPAMSGVALECGVPHDGSVKIDIYDCSGRLVRMISDGDLSRGAYTLKWDGRGAHGETMPTGIYYATLSSASVRIASKIVMVR
jgi:hypothetical protein